MRHDARAPVGVFDSGVGGLSILRALRAELPREDYVYFADTGHAPYGERGDAFVIERCRAILGELVQAHRIKGLVVACNTATAAAIHLIREEHPGLPVVAVEPALKPASVLTLTGRVAVFGTRGTVTSSRVAALRDSLQHLAQFVLQPCDGLAAAIERHDTTAIQALCEKYVLDAGPFGAAPGEIDTLVLGCTHYPFAQDVLQRFAGPAVRMVETGAPVARQTRRLLDAAGLLRPAPGRGSCRLLTTGSQQALEQAATRWL
ncbi:glutamate racemase [Ramlibacter solisilvae]|uniref:Glutamate racemase n=1 Tax=Ramlibacter tataouinensis TaxID=94132 RepID=A0A127JP24_9BURK|nr:glutamate racemase [Ramlibacter tataouinensis]AMO21768.1 glutamate racemase [Ramlibacter tataouinensis]